LRLVTTDTVDRDLWDEFVERHLLGSIYHHSAWQDVIKKTYGYQQLYHLLLDDNANLQAAISSALVKSWLTGNRIISYPFSDTCDPLVSDSDESDRLRAALARSRDEVGARFLELRLSATHSSAKNGDLKPDYLTHILPLNKEPKDLFKTFHKSSIQRAIKKAQKEDLEVFTGSSAADLKTFYTLHLSTRKKHGVPTQPFRFFDNLWQALCPRNMLTLLLARYRGRYVAGIIVLWFNNIAYYKFGASDDRFQQLRANQLLMWEAIRTACGKGCSVFDFGRTSIANKGLAQYKSRWAATELPLQYLRLPYDGKSASLDEGSRKHGLFKIVMARMPLIMLRMSGELLYKHFA
jgi:CelD/BcsL family acetyltransferase involved in cellulose biosynthesis